MTESDGWWWVQHPLLKARTFYRDHEARDEHVNRLMIITGKRPTVGKAFRLP